MKIYLILESDSKFINYEKLFKFKTKFKKIFLNSNLNKNLKLNKIKKEESIILVTNKILSRKDKFYLTIEKYIKNNNINLIEVGIQKSNVETSKTLSNVLIHGFEKNSWKILEKLIGNLLIK